jgi:hypothetical protein
MKRRIPKSPKEREKVFRELLSLSQKSERKILFELGWGLKYEYAPKGVKFAIKGGLAGYVQLGKTLGGALQEELYHLFCDSARKKPKTWVNELMGGELRNLALGLLVAVAKEYNVGLGIAVPAVAFVLKKKISTFCSHPPHKRFQKSVSKILAEEKTNAGTIE